MNKQAEACKLQLQLAFQASNKMKGVLREYNSDDRATTAERNGFHFDSGLNFTQGPV
jgi:hypothetical protein